MSDNLVPGPQATIFDAVNSVVNDEQAAQAIMANPSLAKDVDANGVRGHGKDDGCCGGQGAVAKGMARFRSKPSMRSAVPRPPMCVRPSIR